MMVHERMAALEEDALARKAEGSTASDWENRDSQLPVRVWREATDVEIDTVRQRVWGDDPWKADPRRHQ